MSSFYIQNQQLFNQYEKEIQVTINENFWGFPTLNESHSFLKYQQVTSDTWFMFKFQRKGFFHLLMANMKSIKLSIGIKRTTWCKLSYESCVCDMNFKIFSDRLDIIWRHLNNFQVINICIESQRRLLQMVLLYHHQNVSLVHPSQRIIL